MTATLATNENESSWKSYVLPIGIAIATSFAVQLGKTVVSEAEKRLTGIISAAAQNIRDLGQETILATGALIAGAGVSLAFGADSHIVTLAVGSLGTLIVKNTWDRIRAQGWPAGGARGVLTDAIFGAARRHPFVTAGILTTASVAVLVLATGFIATKAYQDSGVEIHEYCMKVSDGLWCTTKSVTETATNAIFTKREPTTIWTPDMNEFEERSLVDLAGGKEIVLPGTTTVRSVANLMKKWFGKTYTQTT